MKVATLTASVLALLMVGAGCGGDGKEVTVPYVVGLQESHAVATAKEAGLQVRIERRRDAPAPSGVVYEQSPAEGAKVAEGTTLKILVSSRAP